MGRGTGMLAISGVAKEQYREKLEQQTFKNEPDAENATAYHEFSEKGPLNEYYHKDWSPKKHFPPLKKQMELNFHHKTSVVVDEENIFKTIKNDDELVLVANSAVIAVGDRRIDENEQSDRFYSFEDDSDDRSADMPLDLGNALMDLPMN